jgi:hypothetical protein
MTFGWKTHGSACGSRQESPPGEAPKERAWYIANVLSGSYGKP